MPLWNWIFYFLPLEPIIRGLFLVLFPNLIQKVQVSCSLKYEYFPPYYLIFSPHTTLCFRFQWTKYFGGQNFSADKIFGSKSDFRQFNPPKFCPIRLFYHKHTDRTHCIGSPRYTWIQLAVNCSLMDQGGPLSRQRYVYIQGDGHMLP